MGNGERITLPEDLSEFARDSERKLAAPASETRPFMSPFAVPWLVVTFDDLRAMPLGSEHGFVLSLVDGRATVEMIVDMAGLPEDETIGILSGLLHMGAIELREPSGR